MPTRKVITETIENETETPEVIEIDEIEEAAESALDGMLAEFSGADDVSVNVYRQGEGKNISFLFKTLPEDMNGGDIMERCRDQFGTGDYRLHVRKGSRILANRSFSVEAPKAVAPTAPRDSSGDIVALITAQMANQQQMFLGAMTAMAEAFKGGNNNAPPPIDPVAQQNSILAGIVTMKELAETGQKGPDAVTMLIKGMELAGNMAPKSGDTNFNDIALKAIEAFPALAAVTGQQKGPAPQPVPGQIMRPVTVNPGQPSKIPPTGHAPQPSPAPTPETAPAKDKETEAFILQARANLQWLCRLAQADKDPGLYAEVILDQMGPETVLEFIGHDNALQQLAQIEPMVDVYRGWFLRLKDAILELTAEENEAETAPEGELIAADEPPTPEIVIQRINETGLRRTDAPVTVRETDTARADGSDSEPSGDTARP